MKRRIVVLCLCMAALWVIVSGCSASASIELNSQGQAVLQGADAILVTAKQPEPPPPPKPMKAKLVEKRIEISEKVMFDYKKATIKPVSHDLLNDVATVITQHPKIRKIQIEGHTCDIGSDEYNQDLSERRAKAVKEFLVKVGIPEEKLDAVGFGESRPIASNETDEGKEQNRRVEFNITDQEPEMVEAPQESKEPQGQ